MHRTIGLPKSVATFPHDENHFINLLQERFSKTGSKKSRIEPRLVEHSIRVAKTTHEMTRCLPLAVEGLFHAFELDDVLEKCPEVTGLINPHQFKAYKMLKNWELKADFQDPATIKEFLNFLHRFPLAVVLRVLDIEDISNNGPKERIAIYKSMNEPNPEGVLRSTTNAIDALYVPIARRLGWQETRWKLRDVSLSVHYPNLRERIFDWHKKHEEHLDILKSVVANAIPTSSALSETRVRIKTRESLFRKLVKKSGTEKEGEMIKKYAKPEEILEASPDIVATQCVLRKGSKEGVFYVKNLLIPRLKREGFEIEKTSKGGEFEVKNYKKGEVDFEVIHVIAKPHKKFGPYPVEIQVLTQEADKEFSDGEFAHENYKGGKLDVTTMKKIGRIGTAIRIWEPEDEISRNLVYIKAPGIDQENIWQMMGLPADMTILDLLAAVGNPNVTEMCINVLRKHDDESERETPLFVNPTKLGLMLHTANTSFEVNGNGRTIHETKGAKELKFLRDVMNEMWAATLAGLVHKMMVTE